MQNPLTTHDDIVACLHHAGRHLGAEFIHPACLDTMQMRFTGYLPGSFLSAVLVLPASFANPMGYVQGGFLMAAFDNVFGPFSILESGRSALTLEFNASFLRPLSPGESIEIQTNLVERGRRFLVMEGLARTGEGRSAARAYARMFFVQEES